ncbi:MAG TPA: two-component regulator propeller domain-containing protein [Cyclobacteriaceae bacterium]|nr:two-component regulator propeller domain-containing protein [Cyclobacteriaceae bacterium]
MIKRLILLILLFRLPLAFGQSPYFQQYFLLKKNDPVQIESILKDRTGFMWFGTNKGLFRFDGINTKRFTVADSLSIDHVTALAQDSTGKIWIGHKNGQLSTIDREVVTKVTFPEGDATQEISDILFASDGTMWFATLNDGLYYFNEHLYRLDEADGMPDIFIYDLEEDGDGSIWAGTDRGAVVCTLKDRKASLKVLDYKSGFPDNIIKKMHYREGRMTLATEDAGIFIYDINAARVDIHPNLNIPRITDFLMIGDSYWLASSGSDLRVYDQSNDQMNIYRPQPGVFPTVLFDDEEGSVWIGSRNGLFRSLGRDVKFIDGSPVSAITVDTTGSIWLSNDDGLFKRTVDKNGNTQTRQYLNIAPYTKYKVISLFTDNQGYIWCGFYGQGAIRMNPATGQITEIRNQLGNGNVLSISGAGNKVWLSTLSGASMIDLDKGLAVTNFDRSKGLDCDYVYQVFVDSKGRSWFASDREGVAMLDNSGFHKMIDNLASKAVYGFAEDATGTIWANVQDDGLYKFDGQQFQPSQVLRNINVNCLSSDPEGNLVAVHDLGIDVYNPSLGVVHHLDNEIGFGDRKPSLNATARDGHGNIFFGTDNGVVIYSRTSLPETKPVATIDKFRIFNRYKDRSKGLSLAYDENNVTITFLGFWYQDPQGVNFQYKLENYDVDWIPTADHSAIFSSLPPGSYTFKLRASVDGNFDNAAEDSVSFVIRPPFWQTTVFYLLIGVLAAFAAYTFVRRRERNLQRDKLELETKIAERTYEIVKKNEEIQAQAEEIKAINESLEKRVTERTFELERKNKALEDYAFINAHNLRSPVASILGLVNLFSHAKGEEDAKELIEHMKVSAERLDEVVRTITESIEKSDQFESFKKGEEEGID